MTMHWTSYLVRLYTDVNQYKPVRFDRYSI